MQAIARRFGQQSMRPTVSISSIKSIYPLSDHYYGVDHPRYGSTLAAHKSAIAMPREVLLKGVPVPLPNPDIFNLDQIHAFATDTVVSENALTFTDLGVVPHKLEGYPVEYLIQFVRAVHNLGLQSAKKSIQNLGLNFHLDLSFPNGFSY